MAEARRRVHERFGQSSSEVQALGELEWPDGGWPDSTPATPRLPGGEGARPRARIILLWEARPPRLPGSGARPRASPGAGRLLGFPAEPRCGPTKWPPVPGPERGGCPASAHCAAGASWPSSPAWERSHTSRGSGTAPRSTSRWRYFLRPGEDRGRAHPRRPADDHASRPDRIASRAPSETCGRGVGERGRELLPRAHDPRRRARAETQMATKPSPWPTTARCYPGSRPRAASRSSRWTRSPASGRLSGTALAEALMIGGALVFAH